MYRLGVRISESFSQKKSTLIIFVKNLDALVVINFAET